MGLIYSPFPMLNYLLVSLVVLYIFYFLYVSIRRYAVQSDLQVTVCPIAKEKREKKRKKLFYSPSPMLNYLLVSLVDLYIFILCTYQYVDMLSSQIGMYQDAQSRIKKRKKRGKKS